MPDWFVVNVADAPASRSQRRGAWAKFESAEQPFPNFGINVHVLDPGKPSGLYHSESVQEDFLVLAGECLAIVEGEERRLRTWDFLHCPAGTAHTFVGTEEPCAVLMVGARDPDATIHYPVNEVAAKHGASVKEATSDVSEAYGQLEMDRRYTETRLAWPLPTAAQEAFDGLGRSRS